jgi:hypothetical protein
MPEVVEDPKFKYGLPTVGRENAKDILYPYGRQKDEDPAI